MESYFQYKDLWEIVGGSEITPSEDATAMKKWKIKVGKTTFTIRTTVEDDMLEHIKHVKTQKGA